MADYIRYYNNSYGHYMNMIPFPEGEFKNKILELFKKTKYNGIFEIEFMKGPNDEKYFLDVLLRGTMQSLYVGGICLTFGQNLHFLDEYLMKR